MKFTQFIIIPSILILISCTGGEMSGNVNYAEQRITASDIENLETNRIYFAHQSVGYDILDGVSNLLSDFDKTLNIVETSDVLKSGSFFLVHSTIGENTKPETKFKDFSDKLNSGLSDSVDIAFLKLCYVDINPATDVDLLFTDYKSTMDELNILFPDIEFVHFTVPLMTQETGLKPFIKKIIGRQVRGVDDNLRRQEYNELLRAEYSGKEPLFDIAEIESTMIDGSRNVHSLDGKEYYSMVPEYTTDGGHLNERGSALVAGSLIKFLSELKLK